VTCFNCWRLDPLAEEVDIGDPPPERLTLPQPAAVATTAAAWYRSGMAATTACTCSIVHGRTRFGATAGAFTDPGAARVGHDKPVFGGGAQDRRKRGQQHPHGAGRQPL
jgi:hypothetical protein